MAKVGTFGRIPFRVSDQEAVILQNMKREISGRWSEMERIGKKPLTVFAGAELQKITLTVFLDAGLGTPPRDLLEEIETMAEQGQAELTCQFCDRVYPFTKEELEALLTKM